MDLDQIIGACQEHIDDSDLSIDNTALAAIMLIQGLAKYVKDQEIS